MSPKGNAKLKSLIKEKALLVGDNGHFELASGDKSNYFFDMKLISMDPEGSELIANAILELLKNEDVDYIGGLESGAIPIAAVIANRSLQIKKPIPAFFVRKTPKERGTKKMIEGNLIENSNVVLIDDVTTKGESVLLAVRKVRELNCHVNTVITIVDRLSGAKENLAKENIKLVALFTKNDFNL
jgi:orotate phosphoribosyltransferase